ncbi:MAG TPA: DSD1 family PLP-dependent enzyme [Pirellulales bacterium]|nr:DSD1 family PLP-dependent enzyme [Pirellulales bacterium]
MESPTSHPSRSLAEIDAQLRRAGRPEDLYKADLPTPALLVDLDQFERNIKRMADHAKRHGKGLRPHAKTHKCVEVARRQCAAGAHGVCVATVPEAIVLTKGKIESILLTSPIANASRAAQIAALAESCELFVAVDHPQQVALYNEAARAAGVMLNLLVDLNVGDRRTGASPGEPAVEIGAAVMRSKNLRLRGLQAYSGGSSHIVGYTARRDHSLRAMAQAVQTCELFAKRGLPLEILSGASTGTHNIDSQLAELTELQVGSYVFMDVDYRRIGGTHSAVFDEFAPSLTVLTTVVSANHRDRVTLDAGFKAFATDRTFGPEPKDVTGLSYSFAGDEFGALTLEQPSREIALGDRLEFIVPHCDPTVNLYDRIYACRGDKVEEIWSVMDRLCM